MRLTTTLVIVILFLVAPLAASPALTYERVTVSDSFTTWDDFVANATVVSWDRYCRDYDVANSQYRGEYGRRHTPGGVTLQLPRYAAAEISVAQVVDQPGAAKMASPESAATPPLTPQPASVEAPTPQIHRLPRPRPVIDYSSIAASLRREVRSFIAVSVTRPDEPSVREPVVLRTSSPASVVQAQPEPPDAVERFCRSTVGLAPSDIETRIPEVAQVAQHLVVRWWREALTMLALGLAAWSVFRSRSYQRRLVTEVNLVREAIRSLEDRHRARVIPIGPRGELVELRLTEKLASSS